MTACLVLLALVMGSVAQSVVQVFVKKGKRVIKKNMKSIIACRFVLPFFLPQSTL
jgi:hypothetical protein